MLTGAHDNETVSTLLGHGLLLAFIALASDYQLGACGGISVCRAACSYSKMTGWAATCACMTGKGMVSAAPLYLCVILYIKLC